VSVGVAVCEQDNWKSYGWIFMKFGGIWTRKELIEFKKLRGYPIALSLEYGNGV